MAPGELLRLVWESVTGHRLRSALTTLGIVIGIAAVALLSSVGEGARRGIAEQFSQFGTTLLSVAPGKTETFGVPGALVGTTRRLTLADAEALRRIPGVREMDASVSGAARVECGERTRDVYVLGVMEQAQEIWRWRPRVGAFVPPGDPESAPAVCVLGAKLARELFGEKNPLGEPVRVGQARFRVIGVMEPKGAVLGFDLDDAVFIPVVRAMRLFNQFEIHEIHLDVANYRDIDRVADEVTRVMKERHQGEEDVTVVTQAAMLGVIDTVMSVVTRGVVAIAAVALLVGAMGILTVMWLSVHERTREIGLLKAIGASNPQVMSLFLGEAALLSMVGGVVGIALGVGGGWLLERAVPALRVELPPGMIPIQLAVALGVGLLAGAFPARRAARLDPVEALREE